MLSTTLHYDDAIVRSAFRRFWWRRFGAMLAVSSAVLLALGLGSAVYFLGNDPGFIGVVGATLVFSCVCLAAISFIPVRDAMRRFGNGLPPEVQCAADETALLLHADAGIVRKPWTEVKELWRFAPCWLLLSSGYTFFILPTTDLSPALQDHIIDHVRGVGGRIR